MYTYHEISLKNIRPSCVLSISSVLITIATKYFDSTTLNQILSTRCANTKQLINPDRSGDDGHPTMIYSISNLHHK